MEQEGIEMIGFRYGKGSSIMKLPDEVSAIMTLKRAGYGTKTIAKELGISKTTVKRYVHCGGWIDYKSPERPCALRGLEDWLRDQMGRHGNNAEVVRQELEREKGITVSLRTIERAVRGFRTRARAEATATIRYETAPAQQMQIDFGERHVVIAGERTKVYFFVATLGYSRRNYVRAFTDQRVDSWFAGMESAFRHFGGITETVLLDNPKALVKSHDVRTREVTFSDRFKAFAAHWGFRPQACAPYRARTKGKDERGVGYVKRNAIAGREFASWGDMEGHLEYWMREVADRRIHGTTEERPIDRFERERNCLRRIEGKPSFVQVREVVRIVHSDLCVELDTNSYSVPWECIGQEVTVSVRDGVVSVRRAGTEIAVHREATGRKERVIDRRHYRGLVFPGTHPASPGELARSLDEYAAVAGGL